MEPENEFNKPLKGYASKKEAKKSSSALVTAGLALLIGLPVFHFYGGFDAILSPPPKPTEVAEVSTAPEPQVPEVEEPEDLKIIPKREHTLDPEGGDFQQLKPLEKLEPLKPLTPVIQPPIQPKEVRRQEQALAHLPDPELSERGATGIQKVILV